MLKSDFSRSEDTHKILCEPHINHDCFMENLFFISHNKVHKIITKFNSIDPTTNDQIIKINNTLKLEREKRKNKENNIHLELQERNLAFNSNVCCTQYIPKPTDSS